MFLAIEAWDSNLCSNGEFDIADVVIFQKWLLAVPDTELADRKSADFCDDNRLDVFDLTLMKKALLTAKKTRWEFLDMGTAEYNFISDNAIDVTVNEVGETYEIQYTIDADADYTYNICIQKNEADYDTYYFNELTASQNPQTIRDTFTMEEDCPNAKIGFNLGYETGVYHISDVSLTRTTTIEADESNVKLTGRYIIKDDVTWLTQSGSAVEFNVTGQSAELILKNDVITFEHADFLYPRYAVYVDNELLIDKLVDGGEERITLFDESNSVTKTVRVIMLSEDKYGLIGIDGINIKTDSSTPVEPTALKELSIEFIGDSYTCGYGVEGKDGYDSFRTSTENFMKTCAYMTAELLNADYSAVSYSGYGVVSGYSDGDKNSECLVPERYGLCSEHSGYDAEWDFSSHKNDVVVLNLGGNDTSYVDASPSDRSDEYIEGYISFLKTIRKNNENAHIICTNGMMGNGITGMYEMTEKSRSKIYE